MGNETFLQRKVTGLKRPVTEMYQGQILQGLNVTGPNDIASRGHGTLIIYSRTAISRDLIFLGLKGQKSEISIGQNFEELKKGRNESRQNYPGTEMYTDRNVQSTIGHCRVPN